MDIFSYVDDSTITVFRLVMDWANKKHEGRLPRFGVCTSKKMEETKFEDLTIKLGYPYVYTHQGNCEHLLIFRDLRYNFKVTSFYLNECVENPVELHSRSNFSTVL